MVTPTHLQILASTSYRSAIITTSGAWCVRISHAWFQILGRIGNKWKKIEHSTGWILRTGSDDAVLVRKTPSTKEDLDQVTTGFRDLCRSYFLWYSRIDTPRGLDECSKITAASRIPEVGKIRRIAWQRQEPNGLLEELGRHSLLP